MRSNRLERARAAGTVLKKSCETLAHHGQRGDFCLDALQGVLDVRSGRRATCGVRVDESQQVDDLVEGESEGLQLLHEHDAVDGLWLKRSIPGGTAFCQRKNATAFVVANGVDLHASAGGDSSDTQTGHRR